MNKKNHSLKSKQKETTIVTNVASQTHVQTTAESNKDITGKNNKYYKKMKNWDKFKCNKYECVFYDQETDICDFCICNDEKYINKNE